MNQTLTIPATVKPATFSIAGADLAEAVKIVARVAKGTGAYQGIVALSFRDQRLTLSATDFETSIQTRIPVEGKKATAVAVYAAKLKPFVDALKAERVTLDITADELKLVGGNLEFALPLVPDAPAIQLSVHENPIPIDSAEFGRAVRIAGAAAATDQARVIITGIMFENGIAVATDSYRLAVVHDTIDFGEPLLIPAGPASIVADAFAGADMQFENIAGRLQFSNAWTTMTIRRIDGSFPEWERLVPGKADSSFTIDRKQFAARLRNVALAGGVAARMAVSGEALVVTMKEQDVASSKGGIPIDIDGVVPYVGLNPTMLRQLLTAVDSDKVTVEVIDHLKPFKITPTEGAGWTLIQMPVRL